MSTPSEPRRTPVEIRIRQTLVVGKDKTCHWETYFVTAAGPWCLVRTKTAGEGLLEVVKERLRRETLLTPENLY